MSCTRFKNEHAIVLANTLVRDESNEFRAGLADNIGKFADGGPAGGWFELLKTAPSIRWIFGDGSYPNASRWPGDVETMGSRWTCEHHDALTLVAHVPNQSVGWLMRLIWV